MLSADQRLRVDGAGPTVVIQPPAWGPPADYLRETLVPLLGGFRVVTFDARNTGDAAAGAPRPHGPNDLLEDLSAAIDATSDGPVALLGHSHGARIATALALSRPESLRKLVLLTPSLSGGGPDPAADPLLARWANDPVRVEAVRALRTGPGPTPDVASLARWVRRCMPAHFADLERMREFGRALRHAAPPSLYAHRAVAHDPGPDPLDRAAELRVPTLLVSGAFDPLAPPTRVESLARLIPDCRHVVLGRSGHYPWVEEPERFREAVVSYLAPD